eukprot:scaffold316538_cov35-Tisochrysis_lutea.AAC.1
MGPAAAVGLRMHFVVLWVQSHWSWCLPSRLLDGRARQRDAVVLFASPLGMPPVSRRAIHLARVQRVAKERAQLSRILVQPAAVVAGRYFRHAAAVHVWREVLRERLLRARPAVRVPVAVLPVAASAHEATDDGAPRRWSYVVTRICKVGARVGRGKTLKGLWASAVGQRSHSVAVLRCLYPKMGIVHLGPCHVPAVCARAHQGTTHRRVQRDVGRLRVGALARRAEVAQFGRTIGSHHDVLEFYVAVRNILAVEVSHSLNDLGKDAPSLGLREPMAFGDVFAQVTASRILHLELRAARAVDSSAGGNDVGVLELSCKFGFILHMMCNVVVFSCLLVVIDLHSNRLPMLVSLQPNTCKCTLSERPNDLPTRLVGRLTLWRSLGVGLCLSYSLTLRLR